MIGSTISLNFAGCAVARKIADPAPLPHLPLNTAL